MKLFIPTIGTKLRLVKPWTFVLKHERRNFPLLEVLNPGVNYRTMPYRTLHSLVDPTVTMDIGTELTVDRIFIRQGSHTYDSVTFRVKLKHMGVMRPARFWAKLADVNNIHYEVIE